MAFTYGRVSSFTSGGRRMSSPADTSVLILPPSLSVFFFLWGRHFNESVILLSFRHFEAVSLRPLPSFPWNFNALQSKPFSHRRKTEMLCVTRSEGLLLWLHLLVPLRCFQTWIFPPPLNFAGILAAAVGSSKDTAALGKQPFFSCVLIEVALFQKPWGMKYHRGSHKTYLWWMLTLRHSHSVLRQLSPHAA